MSLLEFLFENENEDEDDSVINNPERQPVLEERDIAGRRPQAVGRRLAGGEAAIIGKESFFNLQFHDTLYQNGARAYRC